MSNLKLMNEYTLPPLKNLSTITPEKSPTFPSGKPLERMKKMKKIVIIFLLLAVQYNSLAGIVDGPANIRTSPNGEIICTVQDLREVYVYELEDDWYKIQITGRVKKADLVNDTLLANTRIFENDLTTITGTTITSIVLEENYYPTSDTYYLVSFFGYTHKDNIKSNSIIERELERIIKTSDYNEMDSFLRTFNLHKDQLSDYVLWYAEDNSSIYGNPDPRLILYFNMQNELIAIANHTRKLELNSTKESEINGFFRLQYLVEMPLEECEKFETQANEYFVGLN